VSGAAQRSYFFSDGLLSVAAVFVSDFDSDLLSDLLSPLLPPDFSSGLVDFELDVLLA
jgi:hypothetical protein